MGKRWILHVPVLLSSGQGNWWGQSRVDLGLHCPEAVQNILSRALPPLVHSSYWESQDASCFIVWQVLFELSFSQFILNALIQIEVFGIAVVNIKLGTQLLEPETSICWITSEESIALAERLYGNTITHRCPLIEPIDGVCLTDDGLSDGRVQINDDELALPFRTHNSSPSMNSNGVSGLSRQFRNSISNRLRFKSKATERAKVNIVKEGVVDFWHTGQRSLYWSRASELRQLESPPNDKWKGDQKDTESNVMDSGCTLYRNIYCYGLLLGIFMASCLPYSMTTNPNHRANDAIVLEGQPQIVNARFTFGTLDLSSMANAEVEIFYRPQSVIPSKAMPLERLGSQMTDSNGRLSFQIPDAQRLPVGLHRLQLIPTVKADSEDQAVELTLAVVPPNCNVVICSIDGSFAASLSLMGKPDVELLSHKLCNNIRTMYDGYSVEKVYQLHIVGGISQAS
ncbi:hypothetical protein ACTXT7_008873 [Hymenolepis weldensis]